MAQKALGMAVAEVLPEAEKVLAATQQVGADAAPCLAALAAPAAPVSSAVLGAPHGAGVGGVWQLGKFGPVKGRSGLFLTI